MAPSPGLGAPPGSPGVPGPPACGFSSGPLSPLPGPGGGLVSAQRGSGCCSQLACLSGPRSQHPPPPPPPWAGGSPVTFLRVGHRMLGPCRAQTCSPIPAARWLRCTPTSPASLGSVVQRLVWALRPLVPRGATAGSPRRWSHPGCCGHGCYCTRRAPLPGSGSCTCEARLGLRTLFWGHGFALDPRGLGSLWGPFREALVPLLKVAEISTHGLEGTQRLRPGQAPRVVRVLLTPRTWQLVH